MTDGYFSVRTTLYRASLPIWRAKVYIKRSDAGVPGGEESRLMGEADVRPKAEVSPQNYDDFAETGSDGRTRLFSIAAPPESNSYDRTLEDEVYSLVDVYIEAENYVPVRVTGVQVFPRVESELPVNLIPFVKLFPRGYEQNFPIPENTVISSAPSLDEPIAPPIRPDVLREVYIPENIVVHLGVPSDYEAEDLTVSFPDYIKNVASSEIFPTWPEDAIRANILAQISLTLNRVYTEWYPAQGYSFQITNSTQYDQAFVKGRNIFENISRIVDEIFNTYVRREGYIEPLFTAYCDGVRTQCDGMSQWGTLYLAEQGYTPLEILRYYYGENIELVQTDNIRAYEESFPGTLSYGMRGDDVLLLQSELQRISRDYPMIPEIAVLDGLYGVSTVAAVRAFQTIFNLEPTGVVDRGTWYAISRVYAGVKRIAEVLSEGQRELLPPRIPDSTLRLGSAGADVRVLQYILAFLGVFYPNLPIVDIDGYFGLQTQNAVQDFQTYFGLVADGVVGPLTWEVLYGLYEQIADTVVSTENQQLYPGKELKRGDSGEGVRVMQIYLNQIAHIYESVPLTAEDGVFGEETENAVKAFQKTFGLDADGVIGPLTWTRIVEVYNFLRSIEEEGKSLTVSASAPSVAYAYPGVTLRRGMCGRHVKYLQDALNKISRGDKDRRVLHIDGEYSAGTENAVIAYQKQNGLVPNGQVDEALWNRILIEADRASENA